MDPAKKARLGQRWTCFSCGARFYDLNKPEPVCPKCEANQHESPAVEAPKTTKSSRKKAPKAAAEPEPPKSRKSRSTDSEAGSDPLLPDDEDDAVDLDDLELDGSEELGDATVDEED